MAMILEVSDDIQAAMRVPEAVSRDLSRLEHQTIRQVIEEALTQGWIQIGLAMPVRRRRSRLPVKATLSC